MYKHLPKTILLVLFFCNLSYCQDSTKKSTGFKGMLERRQERLSKVLQNEVQNEDNRLLKLKEDMAGENLVKGSHKILGGTFLLIAANIATIFIKDQDTQKGVSIGGNLVGGTFIMLGASEISEAGQIFKRTRNKNQ